MYQKHLFIANIDNTPQSWVIIRLRKILLRSAHLDMSHLPTSVFVQTLPPILDAGCILLKFGEESGGRGGGADAKEVGMSVPKIK